MGPLGDLAGVNMVWPLKSNKSPATKLFSFSASLDSAGFFPTFLRTGFVGAFLETFDEAGATKFAVDALLEEKFAEDDKDGGGFGAIDRLVVDILSNFLSVRQA